MSPRLHTLLMTTTALLALAPKPGAAGPEGAVVVGGAATVQGQGSQSVIVNQTSNRAIINWNTFNIGTGESARFNQPDSSSVALNRVTGGQGPSAIDGTLTANGKIFLINRDGMLFGPNARINTAGFVATTHDIKNDDFMAGRYQFNIPGRPDASIVNQGQITATNGGFAALVAPGVRNTGTITATLGTVSLASGNMFTLDMYGDKLIQLGIGDEIASQVRDVATGQPLTSLVSNEGRLRANGGRVELTAVTARRVVDSVINNRGVIEANSIGRRNGMIVLGAATGSNKTAGAPKQTVRIGGTLSAAGKRKNTAGGTIVVTGENIEVAGARIDASGDNGGGRVLIGGDWAGGRPTLGLFENQSARLEASPIATASTLYVDAATTINASARNSGDGGKVILWSDNLTTFAGAILARGGDTAGNGGFVEVSGKQQLVYQGNVDTRAPNGNVGTLLLDPADYYIDGTPPPGASFTTAAQIANDLVATNVVIQTNNGAAGPGFGDIYVNGVIGWNTNTTLTLSAFRNINVAQTPSVPTIANTGGAAGNLIMRADSTGTGTGTINLISASSNNRIDWTGSTGRVSFFYNPTPLSPGGNKYENPKNFLSVGESGRVLTASPSQFTAYMLVNTAADLQLAGASATTRGGAYALGRNIDASALAASMSGTFNGIFDGNGGLGVNYAIDHLAVGLFSTIGTGAAVRNLTLTNVAINATANNQNIGALAGTNDGTISNVAVGNGTVAGGSFTGINAGGLVGRNTSNNSITQSWSAANVSVGNGTGPGAFNIAGGLVGVNLGTISQSFASGRFSGGTFSTVGGLVGVNGNQTPSTAGTILSSFATGAVSGGASATVGGLVGASFLGTVDTSFATGMVTGAGAAFVGGLLGQNSGAVTNSLWDVQTSGQAASAGGAGATGRTTADLQAALAAGWNASIWGIVANTSYPFLRWQFPNGTPQVVSGTAFNDRAATPAAGVIVDGVLSGSTLVSALTGGSVTTGANGYYYYLLVPGTISPANNQLLAATPGASGGATFQSSVTGSVSGLDIYGAYLRLASGASNYSTVLADLSTAIGGKQPNTQTFVNNLANREIDATAASFSIDQPISTGTLVLSTSGAMNQTAALTANNLVLLGAAGNHELTNAGNTVGTLAANVGANGRVNLTDTGGISIGTVAGTNGVNAGTLILTNNGSVIQSAVITVGELALLGAGGSYTLANPGNQIGTLAANTGSVNLTDTGAISIGTVANTNGVNASTLILTNNGSVIQSAAITVAELALLGAGGSYTLTNSGNQIGTLAANTGSVNLTDTGGLSIGTVGSVSGVSADTLILTNNGPVIQSSAITAANVALLGAGAIYTFNSANHVNALAANTGAVSLTNAQTFNIGTVAGTNGVTTSGAFTLNNNGNTITATSSVNVGTFTLAGGGWVQNIAALPAFSATDFRISGGSFLRVTGGNGAASSYSIADLYGLQGIVSLAPGNNYVLANDINAATASGWNSGAGFRTLGTLSGTFNGQGHAIDQLAIASSSGPLGLFSTIGANAMVSNLNLTNVSILAAGNLMFVGGLAGENLGTVSNVSGSGSISGGSHTGVIAGGVVGTNRGAVTGSSSAATVSVGNAAAGSSVNVAGGVVGSNQGSLTNSSASGNIGGGTFALVGGLAGQNGLTGAGGGPGTISASSASGNVSGGTNSSIGGLVGFAHTNSTIGGSHASGNVALTGNGGWGGGLVGQNFGLIELSFYDTGAVSGTGTASQFAILGGLAGQNQGSVRNSNATATVTGTLATAGGLVGYNFGAVTATNPGQTFANATIRVGGDGAAAGGLVGVNASTGSIHHAAATGSVLRLAGAPASDLLKLGGLAGQNEGGIDHSTAAVTLAGGFSSAGGLVGQNSGAIQFSSASGAVSGFGTPFNASTVIGGLVGNNQTGAFIGNSSASGNVTGGNGTTAGGLVGFNASGVAITQSHASGNVTIGAAGLAGGLAGGLVGDNFGSITNSDATGAVSGGQLTSVGGLVGANPGSITASQATGNVTGTGAFAVGGLVGSIDVSGSVSNSSAGIGTVTGNNAIAAGGLAGMNEGAITSSSASGPVSGNGTLVVGGLAGANLGAISGSSASGAVNATGALAVGGLVGSSNRDGSRFAATANAQTIAATPSPSSISSSFATGAVSGNNEAAVGGLIGLNTGTVTDSHAAIGNVSGGFATGGLIGANFGGAATNSHASGNVSGAPGSFIGGFAGFNFGGGAAAGSITGSHASGNVTAGLNGIAGGFFGVNLFGAIENSYATGAVGGGNGSTVGGFGGLNIGTVNVAYATGPVTGGANSFVGGFAGVNFAVVDANITGPTGTISQSYALGSAAGGANSLVAGFAAINLGSLDQTYASGLVTGGQGSALGGLVASNTFNYPLPPSITLLDPPGTTTNSYWDRQTTGQTASAGGTPFDTAQLATGLPSGFDPTTWISKVGQYPSLLALGLVDTTPGAPVLPPIPPAPPPSPPVTPPAPPPVPPVTPTAPPQPPAQQPVLPEVPAVVLQQQQLAQELLVQPSLATVTPAEVVNTQPVVQQQQADTQQITGSIPASQNAQLGPQPIRLDVGENRYFYLPPPGETRLVQNEVVLQLPCDLPAPTLATVTRQFRLNVLNSQCLGQSGTAVYQVRIGSGQTLASVIRALASHQIVAAAQANYTYTLAQDGVADQPGDPGQYVIDKLKLSDIHRIVKGANVSIAVIDSEIDASHPDLEGVIVNRFDATGAEEKPHAHGTGMAGAIGSHRRLRGIAPSAQLYAIRAFSTKSASTESTTFNILKGLDWAVNNGVRIVNMSFAGPKDPSLERALKAAYDKGTVLIAAAGNAGPKSPALYPAADKNVIAVTATDVDDKLFSNANRGSHIAIAAPGVDILVPAPEGTYQMTTGTSVATAHISGIVALLLERNPGLTPDEIRRILAASAKRLGARNEFGAGLVDPTKAIELAAPKSAAAPAPLTR